MLEVVEGVHYIHSEGIVHGDLRGVFFFNMKSGEMLMPLSG